MKLKLDENLVACTWLGIQLFFNKRMEDNEINIMRKFMKIRETTLHKDFAELQ